MSETGQTKKPESNTSLSLLSALKDDVRQHQAWQDFVARYGKRIDGWCRRWGLQESDAADVTQNVLLQLSRQMQSFQYDPNGRFRSWLKTIAWRAWVDYLKSQNKNAARPGSLKLLEQLDAVAAKDDLMQRLDDEANREVLEVAIRRIRGRVQENTFEAFRLMTFDGLSGAETAKVTGMKVGSVFVAKSRIDKMLSEEVELLER